MKIFLVLPLLFLSMAAFAQDEAFLACAGIENREARVRCLEEALDQAVEQQATQQVIEEQQAEAVENFGTAQPEVEQVAPAPATEQAVVEEKEERSFFRLPRITNIFRRGEPEQEAAEPETVVETAAEATQPPDRVESFGRETRVVVNDDGEDELIDVISELYMARPNQWLIRLASGQVWRQTHPKRINLREGDNVRIYPSHWGDNFRLETPRLSGFIQVLRVE